MKWNSFFCLSPKNIACKTGGMCFEKFEKARLRRMWFSPYMQKELEETYKASSFKVKRPGL